MRPTHRRAGVALAAAALSASALAGAAVIAAAPAQAASETGGTHLLGRWVGHFDGYYQGTFKEGQEKIVISKARGNVALGTYQWRLKGDHWSAPQPATFVVHPGDMGGWDVAGADGSGTYDGCLRIDGVWETAYVGSMPSLQGLHMRLTKR